ncbi:MAG: recombinase [Methyloprofundus sp.]|nr:recombinase [Methyloprofundus sp.]
MDDYEQYEEDCEKIRDSNADLLNGFEAWLKASGLAPKTITNHRSNIDFYINEFLLYEDATEAKEGVDEVNMFLGYWFIKKAMWASPASIRSNAASLKKFYTFMEEKKLIGTEDLNNLKQTIKEYMPEWLESLERYDDPSIDIW